MIDNDNKKNQRVATPHLYIIQIFINYTSLNVLHLNLLLKKKINKQ